MTENYISFEMAKLAKEKGFDKFFYFYATPRSKIFGIDEHNMYYPVKNIFKKIYNCNEYAVYNEKNIIPAPTQSLLQKWLREEFNVQIEINMGVKYINDILTNLYSYSVFTPSSQLKENWEFSSKEFKNYEEALERGLQKALEIIKK